MNDKKKDQSKADDTQTEEHVWQPELDEIKLRQLFAEEMGGVIGIQRQHDAGKLTARERIRLLLDKGSFREVGAFTGTGEHDEKGKLIKVTPSNMIMGKGKISGRRVVVSAEDFTVKAGSSEAASPDKMVFAERLAMDHKIPLIRLVDAVGGSIRLLEKNQSTKIPGYDRWQTNMGLIPVVGIALGPCAGLGAARVVGSHFSVMVKEMSQVFAAGPWVVGPGMHQDVTKEALGGSALHTRGSGVIDNEAENEEDAFLQVSRFLSYMPTNCYRMPPYIKPEDSPDRREPELASIVPKNRRRVYDVRKILQLVFDKDSLFEIGRYQGPSEITMLGRINGYPVGILANDSKIQGGLMTEGACEKMIRFVDMCDAFHLPIVNFLDQPGVDIGLQAEARGTIRKAIRLQMAVSQANVPWATFFIRRSFGVAGSIYEPRGKVTIRRAWPSAYWGSIPIEGGVEAAYKRDILNAPDPKAKRDELVDYYRGFENPFRTAERFNIEEIIDPRETRPILCEWIEEAYEEVPLQLGLVAKTIRI